MEPSRRDLEERIAFLQRHVEQQDRVLLELSREVAKLVDRLARLEAKAAQAGDRSAADEVVALVTAAVSSGSLLTLADEKGRTVLVPGDR